MLLLQNVTLSPSRVKGYLVTWPGRPGDPGDGRETQCWSHRRWCGQTHCWSHRAVLVAQAGWSHLLVAQAGGAMVHPHPSAHHPVSGGVGPGRAQ